MLTITVSTLVLAWLHLKPYMGGSVDHPLVGSRWMSSCDGLDSVFEAMEKAKLIRKRLKTAQSRQKSYTDVRRRDLEFEVGDLVYLKISPHEGGEEIRKEGEA